jgi:predicted ATPase
MSSVPRPSTPFIGRTDALRRLGELVDEAALVTITGVSGVGKTRVAIELATARDDDMAGGVVFVDLTEARSEGDVIAAVCAELRLARPAEGVMMNALGHRGQTLVVLDNFEQIVHLAETTIGRWQHECPNVHFVVTSRERLRVGGEVVFELEPLALPVSDEGDDSASVQLWVQARRRVDPAYAIERTERDTVHDIVRAVDGIPLAIELAAARADVLGTTDLLDRLSRRFEVLAHGARDAPARQATMRGAIDWSWALLEPWEQSALAQCSVFRGGFAFESAEAVVDLSMWDDAPILLDVIHALRDKSLLRVVGGNRAPRLDLYSSIRDFAAEKLASLGLRGATVERASAHFAALARRLDDDSKGPRADVALDRISAERSNFSAAAAYETERDQPSAIGIARAVDVLGAVDTILATRGPIGAHLAALDRVIELATAVELAPVALARALAYRGTARGTLGNVAGGSADVERAVALVEAVDDHALLATMLLDLSWFRLRTRALDEVDTLLARARQLATTAGDRRVEGMIVGAQGAAPKERGDFTAANGSYREALAIHREVENVRFVGVANTRLAILNLEHGFLGAARDCAEAALDTHRGMKSPFLEALVLTVLGAALHAEERLDDARAVYTQAVPLHRAMGEKRVLGSCIGYLGLAEYELGDVEQALERLRESRDILAEAGEPRHAAMFVGFAGAIEAIVGRAEHGAGRLEHARQILESNPDARVDGVLRVLSGMVALGRARADGEDADAAAVASAREALASVESATATFSVDIRIAARLLRRELESHSGASEREEILFIGALGNWFAPPGGERVDCRRRHTMRRLLVKLARQRMSRPGVPLDAATLVATGWPGERMSVESANNRLYVTMNRLRALGLRDVLLAVDGGYLLDADRPVRFVSSGE